MENVSKQVFLNFLQCPTLGWLRENGVSILLYIGR